MNDYTILGMVLTSLITISGLYFTLKNNASNERKPIEDLNINITKLTGAIESMKEFDDVRDRRINEHGKEIDTLARVVDKHELRISNLENEKQ